MMRNAICQVRSFRTIATPLLKELRTSEEISKYLNTPTWSIKHYLRPVPSTSPVSNKSAKEIFDKMVKLSGLYLDASAPPEPVSTDLPEVQKAKLAKINEREGLIRSLKLQMMFIRHLYEDESEIIEDVHASAGDHGVEESIKLDELRKKEEGRGEGENPVPGEEQGGVVGALRENDIQFRLIASDHIPCTPLTLTELLRQVDEIDLKVDAGKGELGFNMDRLKTL